MRFVLSFFRVVALMCGCGFRHQGMDDVDGGAAQISEEFE